LLEWLRLQQVVRRLFSNLPPETQLNFSIHDGGFRHPVRFEIEEPVLLRLYNWLLDRYRAGETAVLIVDEASEPD